MNRLQKQWVVPSELSSTLLMHMQLATGISPCVYTVTVVLEIGFLRLSAYQSVCNSIKNHQNRHIQRLQSKPLHFNLK